MYEPLDVLGGALDSGGDPRTGYTARGDRELHASHECLWYLLSKIPSPDTPGLTILDEIHLANIREPIQSNYRTMHHGKSWQLSW